MHIRGDAKITSFFLGDPAKVSPSLIIYDKFELLARNGILNLELTSTFTPLAMIPQHIPYFEDADADIRASVPTIERGAINAIIYNPSKDEVLCLDWQKFGWKTFVIGGIEEGEDAQKAALREIVEETGYTNLRLLAELGQTRSKYYAAHKGENRISNATCMLFELLDESKIDVPDALNQPHIFIWLPLEEVSNFLTPNSQKYIWEKAQAFLSPK